MIEFASFSKPSRLTNRRKDKTNMSPRSSQSDEDLRNHSVVREYYFLTAEAALELPNFVYKGTDNSLLYKYILSPLATFCVNQFTPTWLAPNTITFIGLLFMISSYSIHWYYAPSLEVDEADLPPRWIFLFNGIALLIYQTLDNMDGKQARKTGSSSPLGLLFDHGCDALNSVFGSANWTIAMALHPLKDAWLCWSILFGPYALFYIGTWEEFYTGELVMPIFNGPSEGLAGGAMMSFTSFLFGPQFWQSTTTWDLYVKPILVDFMPFAAGLSLRHADMLILASNVGFVQETVSKTIFVARNYGAKALLNLFPFVCIVAASLIIGLSDYSVWLDMPRTTLHLFAALFVEMTTDLMLAHVSHQRYKPFRFTLVPLIVLAILVSSGTLKAGEAAQNYILCYCSCVCTFTVFRLVVLVDEIAHVLNIWCFDITTERPAYRVEASTNGKAKEKIR